MTNWTPATEAETAMRDALRAGDQELYFRILARTELLLPVSPDALAGRAPMGWGTWTSGGRTHVLAFTSAEALRACLAEHAGSARKVPYHELAQSWPNLEWWLAVNPGLPVEGYLPAWFVGQLARGDVRLPDRTVDTRQLDRAEQGESVASRARATAAVPAQNVPTQESVPAQQSDPAARAELLTQVTARSGTGRLAAEAPAAPAPPAPSPAGSPHGVNGSSTREESAPQPLAPVREPAAPPAGEPDFVPANDVENNLLNAAGEGSTDTFLSTLLLARVLLPVGVQSGARPGDPGFTWRTETVDDQMYVVVFTSPERQAEFFDGPVDSIEVRFVQLIKAWPGESWSFAVNPGSPVGAKLPGAQIVALASWAAEVGLGVDTMEDPDPAPAATAAPPAPPKEGPKPTVMQKTVPASKIDYYLTRGYDRVCGFVHRANEVAHLRTPAEMRTALGLGYPGSPFSADEDVMYVLRWPAYRPSLYRIPYGGQTETAMRAMEGWVIQRGPFRGNGFAPSDSPDVIAEFKVDSVRLPHGAQLWRVKADGGEELIALFDSDGPKWQRVGES